MKAKNPTLLERAQSATSALLAGTRLGNAFDAFTNHYKAAQFGDPRRSLFPAFYRDARFDANQFTRYEMARKIRDHQRNVWLIRRLQSLYSQYSVGPNGLSVTPASSDVEWNKRMEDAYAQWCESPSRDSALPMGEQHQLIADTTHIDGGCFMVLTSRKPGRGQSVPAIQLIEGHRVATPGGQVFAYGGGNSPSNVVDGVQIDANGRPVGYHIRDSFDGEDYAYRPIYDPLRPGGGGVLHIYDPDRIGMYREITPYHAVLNQTTDLDMLAVLEMDRAKANAEIAYNISTVDGELPDAQNLVRKNYRATTPTGAQDSPDAEQLKRLQQFRTVLGARVTATRIGEKMEQFGSESPSASTQWYWKFLIEQICESVNIPVLLVLPESYQGTTARGILSDANIWFRDRFFTFARPARAAYLHFASWAIYNINELADPPADWKKAIITPPRSVDVDVGRNSAVQLAELAAGITNFDDIAGANGKTARELITKKARNIGLIKQIAAEVGTEMGVEIDPAEISQPIADVMQKLALAEQSQAQADAADKVEANSGMKELKDQFQELKRASQKPAPSDPPAAPPASKVNLTVDLLADKKINRKVIRDASGRIASIEETVSHA